MEIKKLNKLYYMKKNIKELEEELAELNNLGSAPLNDMPKGNTTGNPTESFVIKKSRILEKLKDAHELYLSEYEKISDFINNIEDEEIKLIARLRFIKHKDWESIGKEVNADRTTPSKKFRKYWESLDK